MKLENYLLNYIRLWSDYNFLIIAKINILKTCTKLTLVQLSSKTSSKPLET